ncbi:MAG: hypothetical protein GF317_19700 [Candidatus Lokiarchaeota archaeon]|nr:hypothetical protein [Candidatus Lokiarchaeota archaeon]MBD3201722.1 hypothetical protein [Candidatus Lokiarchaeota archaeon]
MSSTESIVFGIVIGVLAYSIQNIGKGIQKYAIEGLKKDKKIKSKSSGIWILGTILTSLYLFIQWLALLFAPINAIAPLESVGLIVFILFSYFVLKEGISKLEIVGIIFILIGIVLVTFFNINPSTLNSVDINLVNLIIFIIPLLIAEIIGILLSRSKGYRGAGFILGITGGTLMALQTVSKRITAVPDVNLTILFSILTMVFAIGSLLSTQLAFAKSKANRVVPFFIPTSILLAIVTGYFALSEVINLFQIGGILLVLIGVGLLSGFRDESERESS